MKWSQKYHKWGKKKTDGHLTPKNIHLHMYVCK